MAQKQKFGNVELTFELIEPLIIHTEMQGTKVFVEFRIPGTDEVIESDSNMKREKSTKGRMKQVVKRTMANNARRTATRMMRQALGSNMISRSASMAMNAGSRDLVRQAQFGKAEKNEAIIQAFVRVSHMFHYDEETQEWSKSKAPAADIPKAPFEQQIIDAPIRNGYDQEILARIMAELANADGHLDPEEEAFFNDVIPPEFLPLESLMKKDPVNSIECEEVSEHVKATIYQFAWAIALVDYDLDPVEEELLMEYSDMFQFTDDKREELVRNAKYHVLERAIHEETSREELYEFADRIRLDHFEAERCRARMKKRQG